MRFEVASGKNTATVLEVADGPQNGGPVVLSSCLIWISEGNLWVRSTEPPVEAGTSSKISMLATPISDAIGLTADSVHVAFTRKQLGSVQRVDVLSACAGGVKNSQLGNVASGFSGIGDVITYSNNGSYITWLANNGIFSVDSNLVIRQMAPDPSRPQALGQGSQFVVFQDSAGEVVLVGK